MPELQYPKNPNSDTAFVVQEDGTKNRALMTAPQDTSTLELPKNANSCKGYVTVDGKKQRVILTADIGGGGGGGGSVDYAKTVQRAETMPTADASNAGQQFLYSGESDATYTHGYIYENVKTATYTGTVSFEAATLSGTTVTCSGDNFANFLTEAGADPTPIVSGTMTYEADANGWRLVGKDSNDNTVTTFIEYVEDYEDAGFVFTGTPQDGDVIAFTCTVEEASATYAWTRIDVQPSGGNFLPLTGGTLTGDLTMQNSKVQLYNSSILGSFWLESADSGYLRIGKSATASNDDLFVNTGTVNQRSIAFGNSNGGRIGSANAKLEYVYTQKLSNGSDITVPTTGGTMAVIGVNTTATLAVADWSSSTQTVTVSGVKADSVVFVSPAPASASDYASAGILCTSQGTDSLTFTCTTTPTNAITVNVVCM